MKRGALALAAALLVIAFLLTRGPDPATPNPPGTFSFAALGDAPYFPWEEWQYRLVLEAIDSHDLACVLHIGDIMGRPCSDAMYETRLAWFNGLRHPVVYTPGDNEWTDCWEVQAGGYKPIERLERLRQVFYRPSGRSLGERTLLVETQASDPAFQEFVENVRWVRGRILFTTAHIVGSWNGTERFPSRSEADIQAVRRRTEAGAAWVREAFKLAVEKRLAAVVVAFHANPRFEDAPGSQRREPFEPFLTALEEEAERFRGPVLLVHGDLHVYTVDQPLVGRTTRRRLDNVTRVQVPGSPHVGWVRIIVAPGARQPFTLEPHVVPRWKFW